MVGYMTTEVLIEMTTELTLRNEATEMPESWFEAIGSVGGVANMILEIQQLDLA